MMLKSSILLGADAPRVLTVPMVRAVLADFRRLPARNTVFRWLREQTATGALLPITRGLYLNQLAAPKPAAAEAAQFVRAGAVVSLQTVLGESGVSNNYSDIVVCTLPQERSLAPSTRSVRTQFAEFRFHALPARLMDNRGGGPEDRLDDFFAYPRATREKALLDWIYLGSTMRAKISGPPLDLDTKLLDAKRLRRLAKAMRLTLELERYFARKSQYDLDPEVAANAGIWRS